jgi:hypothetical protein
MNQPSERDKEAVLDAANALVRAENAAEKSPNDPGKAAEVLRRRVLVTQTALEIGKRLAVTPEEKRQVAKLEADFLKAKRDLDAMQAELDGLARAKSSFLGFATKKYAGVPVYGWAGIALGTGFLVKQLTRSSK